MNPIYFVSQFITYFRRNEAQKSRTAWVEWREIVQEVYRENYHLSKIKLIINSGTAEYKKIISYENSIKLMDDFNEKDKLEILQLIYLFLQLLYKEKDVLIASKLETEYIKFRNKIIEPNKNIIDSNVQEWLTKKSEDKFYFKIKLEGTLTIILIDFILRFISLWFYKNANQNDLFSSIQFFSVCQFLIIPILVIFFSYLRDKSIDRKTNLIFQELGRSDLKIINHHSPWNYLISFLILIIGILISVITLEVSPEDYGVALPIFTILYGSYLIFQLSFFSKKKPSISQIMNQLEKININQVKLNLDHLENDEEIVELEVSLRSANDKMEAYVLEAALFGALAFSGFLQLISSSKVSLNSLSLFSENIFNMFEGLVQFSWVSTIQPLEFLLSMEGILSLMAYLTLFCSVFFLAVIASRLRFNDLSDTIDKTVQLSKIYNEKEENIISSNHGNSNERSNLFTTLIRKHLIKGNLTLEQTIPIMEFMRFFRTLGIFTFFLIVVSGGLFVSVQISLVLAFIMFISFLFFKLSLIIQFIKNVTTQFQEFYFSIETKVFYFIWISIVSCFVLRSFSFYGVLTQAVIVISFLVIFIHYLLSLFIPEKLDDIEISESVFIGGNRNKIIIKKLYKIALAVFFLGLMFKMMHFPGAGALILTGSFLLALNFIFTQKTKNNNKFLGLIFRFSFSSVLVGAIFTMMHWPGSNILQLTSIISLIICLILLFIYKNQLFQSTKNITIIFTILVLLLQFSFFRFAFTTLSFNIPVYKEKMKISYCLGGIINPDNGGYAYAKKKSEIDSLKYYMLKTDDIIEKISPHELNDFCKIITENQSDSIVLKHNLKWSNWIIEKDPYSWHFIENIKILIKLKKYELALKKINYIEKMNFKEEIKNFYEDLAELKKICTKNTSHLQ